MKIQLVIRNLSPLFSATPAASTISLDEKTFGAKGGFPLTRTRTMPIPAMIGDTIKPVPVPIIPNNTMRNLIRRTMLDEIIVPMMKGRASISSGAFAACYSGNASGNPEGVTATFNETVKVRQHPFLGLFGGGPRMMEGRLRVDHLLPIHSNAARILSDGFEDRMISGNILSFAWLNRKDPILDLKDDSATEIIKDREESITRWAVKALEQRNQRNKKKDGAEGEASDEDAGRGLRTLICHEVVIPGIDWVLDITVDNPTPAQIGLLLMAISKMPNKTIGGGHSKAYGKFKIEDVILDGQSIWAGTEFGDHEEVMTYFDAASQALDNISADDFESFVAPSKEKAEATDA